MVKYDNVGTVSINLQSFNQVESNIHFVSNLRIKYCHFNPKIVVQKFHIQPQILQTCLFPHL